MTDHEEGQVLNDEPGQKKVPWYRSRWLTFLALFFIPPVGLVTLWVFSPTGRFARVALTVFVGLVLLPLWVVSVFDLEPPPPANSATADPTPTPAPEPDPAPAPPPVDPDAGCRTDLQCWGDRNIAAAGIYCDGVVESMGQYAARWTDGFLEPKFSRFRWADREAGVMTFIGDKIEFQNGFGAWQPHVYECDLATFSEPPRVIDVRAQAGRLP